MEEVREWMKIYRQESGYDPLPFVGRVDAADSAGTIADRIRGDMDLEEDWYRNGSSAEDPFVYIRNKLEECGVIVMTGGTAGQDPRRPLDINEFRAFTLADEWAPLIFINAADPDGARLFSLLHELVYVWMGKNDLYNDRSCRTDGVSQTERTCNAAAAELLVPEKDFLDEWDDLEIETSRKIAVLAKNFRCGNVVIAGRALECRKISRDDYHETVQLAVDGHARVGEQKERSGGDHDDTQIPGLDGGLVRAVCESVSMGRTSYTEAFRLTGTDAGSFPVLADPKLYPEPWIL